MRATLRNWIINVVLVLVGAMLLAGSRSRAHCRPACC
jgi:hypothetical protein